MPDQESKKKAWLALVDKLCQIVKNQEAGSTSEGNEWRARPLAYETLKKLVLDPTKEDDRFTKEDLLLAKESFEKRYDEQWGGQTQFPQGLGYFMTLKSVVKLLRLLVRREFRPGDSLIPIKGISRVMQARLRDRLNVYDVATLLARGATYGQRLTMAKELDADIKLVTGWIKQADLWRINDMGEDMAYLLVQAGVRNIRDLAKVDPEKAYPILHNINSTQVGFTLPGKEELGRVVHEAAMLVRFSPSTTQSYREWVWEYEKNIRKIAPSVINDPNPSESLIIKLREDLRKRGLPQMTIKIPGIKGDGFPVIPAQVEADGLPPVYLFKDGASLDDETMIELQSIYDILNEAFGFLDNIEYTLPLPRTASGTVFIKNADDLDENKKVLPGVLVEVDGIVSPDQDKTEVNKKPRCYTDGRGKFVISMPDRYSLKEAITIIVSDGAKKQKFLMTASDFINSVPEQKVLEEFLALDALGDRADSLSERIRFLEKKWARLDEKKKKEGMTERVKLLLTEAQIKIEETLKGKGDNRGLKTELEDLKAEYKENREKLLERFPASDLKSTFERFMASASKLNARLAPSIIGGDAEEVKSDGFIVIREIFENRRMDMPRALPSVKLMGEGSGVIKLPTDTAPSRIFTYKMLQRLKEPEIFPTPSGAGKNGRIPVSRPLDVEAFKEQMYKDPHNYPQMSTLGIGYTLNMHQAWVPDGFALGTLLYSLVLAPGEEQRLIVRENKQRYSLTDISRGADETHSRYAMSQEDDSYAIFRYAVDQMSSAESHSSYRTSTGGFGGGLGVAGGFLPYIGATLGLSGGFSKASGRASLSSRQSNHYREASMAANSFQHYIKSASDTFAQSKRISISTATSEVSDSVATKIIANHNHSHAMTVQYWEVMRRYRLETCIDSVDLVLFVPLRLIRFLPEGQELIYPINNISTFDRDAFKRRYATVLKYANSLKYYLPYKYRAGMDLIQKYAALPQWSMENLGGVPPMFTMSISGRFLSCDDLRAYLVLKNGKGTVAGTVSYQRIELGDRYQTSRDLKRAIRDIRNSNTSEYKEGVANISFLLPIGVVDEDISHVTIRYSCDPLQYTLYKDPNAKTPNGEKAHDEFMNMMDKYWDLMKDTDDSSGDLRKIEYYRNILPEAYLSPNVEISPGEMRSLGVPEIRLTGLSGRYQLVLSSTYLDGDVYVGVSTNTHTMLYTEFQQMEALLQYLASETLRYSQIVWRGLSDDERAMMLEQYTVKMDFEEAIQNASLPEDEEEVIKDLDRRNVNIPLLNCVNVKKLLGFYGNCMLLPFTFPQSLAKMLGCTATDLQDAICRYHSNSFRAPTTTISLPTNGMVGEAVLGETNVSEKIDLTRFWNWQDSPIDKMHIDDKSLNSMDYLAGKTTKEITPLNLQGATPATPVTPADLLAALVNKQAPTFDNITGIDQLKDILNEATKSAATGRDKVIETSEKMAKAALDFFSVGQKAEGGEEKKGDAPTPKEPGNENKGGLINNVIVYPGGANVNDNPSAEKPKGTDPKKEPSAPKEGEEPKPKEE